MIKIVSGVLIDNHKVLLCYRQNTRFFPEHWALPAGHIEAGENAVDAIRRELFEELGVQMLEGENLMTLFDQEQAIEHQVFLVSDWRGQIRNREPKLCREVAWFELGSVPAPLTPATRKILDSLERLD